jgi:2-hydroxychromene-2-carboxylate isomerase
MKPEPFPQKSVAPARATLALPDGERPAFVRAVFLETFGRGRNMADPAVLNDAAMAAGLPPERIAEGTADPQAKAALFEAVETAKRIGLFGAPSFVTSDLEIFWGDDRLEDALAWERTGSLPAGDRPAPNNALA